MLTSGEFNRNNSAQYFVNMPEHGVCSLHGLTLHTHTARRAMQYQAGCSDFDTGMGTFFSVAVTKIPSAKYQVSDIIHIGANVRHVDILYVDFRKVKDTFGFVVCACQQLLF
jgi:hypothetical protein